MGIIRGSLYSRTGLELADRNGERKANDKMADNGGNKHGNNEACRFSTLTHFYEHKNAYAAPCRAPMTFIASHGKGCYPRRINC